MRVSRVLGEYHYKKMTRVTVGVAGWRRFHAHWPLVPSIGQNLKPFTGYGDVSKWVKNILQWDVKQQTNKKIFVVNFIFQIWNTSDYKFYVVSIVEIRYTRKYLRYAFLVFYWIWRTSTIGVDFCLNGYQMK